MRLLGPLGWGGGAAFQDYGRPNKKRRGEKKAGEIHRSTENTGKEEEMGEGRRWKESVNKGREERRRREGRKGASIFACSTHVV